jgi:3-isopropylmalate/(R)-2-methylmalate dehydratase large subunit
MAGTPGETLYDKLWARHAVHVDDDGTTLLYVDRHLLNEVMSPQAFEGLRTHGRKVWRIASNLTVADHNNPTSAYRPRPHRRITNSSGDGWPRK